MMNLTSRCWLLICALALAVFAQSICAPVEAQDSVAGIPPVFSGPRKQPPKDLQTPENLNKIHVQSPLVMMPVTAIEPSGDFVYDLDENDFQLIDNGVPQRLERFEVATDPLAVVVIIQTNDAVAPLLDQVRPLGSIFSSLLLGEKGQAAVLFFDDRVRVTQDFSNGSDQLSSTLRGVMAHGSKARLNDALERAIAMLERRPKSERRIIITFSDGFDQGSESQPEEVVRRATNDEVTIYGLGFNPAEALLLQKPQEAAQSPLDTNMTRPLPPGMVPTPTNAARVYSTPIPVVPIIVATGQIIRSAFASSLLELYAGYTGGVFYSHWSKKALQEQLSRIASEIHSQYELAYVPDTLKEAGFHRIEVRVRRPDVRVRARAGYFYSGNQ